MSEFTTIILRFRDLGIAEGETIKRHQEIIKADAANYVWWGWWNQPDETLPVAAFEELRKKAQAGELVVHLLDSGQAYLYHAACLDIQWHYARERMKSPEQLKTPDYYRDSPCLAWFQLRDVTQEPNPAAVLQDLTYVQVDDLFKEHGARFGPYYGKRVSSLRELIDQTRTLWFVRPFRAGDKTHDLTPLTGDEPTHFAPTYFETPSRDLLWLSDLHFSENDHHRFPLVGDSYKHDLGTQIEKAIKEQIKIEHVGGVIISGDVSWKAAASEFQMAQSFIDRLHKWTALRPAQIALCPGNHDIAFSADPADKNAPILDAGPKSREAYSAFYQGLFYLAPNQFMSCGRRFLLGKALPLDVVCLNSSLLQQRAGLFQGHGFIGQEQMDNAAAEMGWGDETDEPRALRMVVLHHHLLPTTFSQQPEASYQYSVVLDAEALVQWLVKHRVNLVLHGHMHKPYCAKVVRPLKLKQTGTGWHEFYVLGMGSSGVRLTDIDEEVAKNTIGLLTLTAGLLN